jgi:hypothetical protein
VATAHLSGSLGRARSFASLAECEDDADRGPHGDESGEHPEQKRRLAHGQPRQFVAREEETRAADDPAVFGELRDLAGDRRGRVIGGVPVGVHEDHPTVASLVAHDLSVPRTAAGKTPRRERAQRLAVLCAAALVGVAAGSLAGGPPAAKGAADAAVVLAAGDVARVMDIPVGCRVARRGVPPATMLDCRRAGRLDGTYGVLFGRWNVRVVRFQGAHDAQVVFSARHGSGAVCCKVGDGP